MPTENKASPFPKHFIEKLYLSGSAPALDKGIQDLQVRQSILTILSNTATSEFDSKEELLNLFRLLCFIQAWSDFKETWTNADDAEWRRKRQQMKFKKDIDKSIRRSIHRGLFKSVSEALLRFKHAAEASEKVEIEQLLEELGRYNLRKKNLINVIKQFLNYKEFNFTSENIKENFSEAAKLISTFTRWPDKLLYGCGMGIGLIAALACGISTGGAIFVLLVSFSLPLGFVIPLSVLIFLAGTKANFQLFSQHMPQFFQDLFKKGGVTEFIDQQGKRLQLSRARKFLLFPAAFFSTSVGMAAAAITYLEGTKMLALICPGLVVACPHLTVVLLSILAGALLISLTIVMFRTFIGVLQSQFSWQEIKQDIKEKWQNLNWTKGLSYGFKVFVMVAAFFGLVYLDFTGTSTLAGLLGWVAADAITVAAIMGDLPFTLTTALAWCNSLFKSNCSLSADLPKDKVYYLTKIVEFFALVINALGNAALVFTDSYISRIASIPCFMNSYASNRFQEDDSELIQGRKTAAEKSRSLLQGNFFRLSNSDAQISEANNDERLPLTGLSNSH
ncbi:MAG: hypothetical protein WAL30_02750 [Candidatus Aquirickettsiella sp.]